MTNTKERVTDATATFRPYIERALRDAELRENVQNAYFSARTLYDQLVGRHGVTNAATRLATDADVQAELRKTIEELRQAANRVQDVKNRTSEPARAAKGTVLLVFGIVLGIFFNPITGPALRRLLGRKLFGGGNGFVYRGGGNGTGS